MKFVYKKTFLKQFVLYPASIQKLVVETDQQVKAYLVRQSAPYGTRIKKIGPHTFEARVTDKIRIVWVESNDFIYFVLLGTHDEVKRFIRQL